MKFGNIKYNNFFIITVLVNILLIVLLLINNSQLSFMHRELMKYKNLLFEYTYVNHNINVISSSFKKETFPLDNDNNYATVLRIDSLTITIRPAQ